MAELTVQPAWAARVGRLKMLAVDGIEIRDSALVNQLDSLQVSFGRFEPSDDSIAVNLFRKFCLCPDPAGMEPFGARAIHRTEIPSR